MFVPNAHWQDNILILIIITKRVNIWQCYDLVGHITKNNNSSSFPPNRSESSMEKLIFTCDTMRSFITRLWSEYFISCGEHVNRNEWFLNFEKNKYLECSNHSLAWELANNLSYISIILLLFSKSRASEWSIGIFLVPPLISNSSLKKYSYLLSSCLACSVSLLCEFT